ncbi:restriction endonuclease subunit S [Vibrio parahaemolyticus]|uniref:restriction endonuclease subunit S n=1 Tax=Vibrio parahaemolyticus TaxID=670 RepID=UPI0006A6A89F|nr:restriction endonuclease subunit S [Vibrio parahaemolyticus]EIA1769190.1 restriction endonuclease subunit S [Vibrio parahaemolyticus]ELI5430963.1 restriction endonuclease subunit S [Vibrio parahaemolyticus]
MTKIKNCPQLRFSDFKESWETVRLGNYFTSVCLDSKASYPLYSLTISDGIVPKPARYIREHLVKDELEAYKAMTHLDFAYNPMNVRFGAVAALKERSTVNVSRYYDIFKANEYGDSYFFDEFLKSETMLRVYNKVATGTLVEKKRVHFSEFKELRVPLPSLLEQQKIASFLSKVDEKIALLTEKKDKLTEYKKGVMQQLFNGKWEEQDGQLIFIPPTLRFKADDGSEFPDWEEKKLGEVLTIGNGRDYKHLSDGDIPVFGTGGYMTSVDGYLYDGETVFIGRKGTINKPYMFNGKFWTVDTLFYTKEFKGILPKFVYAIFQKINWSLYNEATGVPSLSKSTINKIKLNLPSLSEQEKITDFISSLDQKVDLINEELEKAKEWKRGLLQQMFV